jgi:hypothetical protein
LTNAYVQYLWVLVKLYLVVDVFYGSNFRIHN